MGTIAILVPSRQGRRHPRHTDKNGVGLNGIGKKGGKGVSYRYIDTAWKEPIDHYYAGFRGKRMKRHKAIYLLLAVLFLHLVPGGAAETIHIAADDGLWRAERGVLNPSPDALTVAVNGETPIILDMNGIETLTFSYQADSWFSLTWDSVIDQPRNIVDAFVQTAQLHKGHGTVTVDFRRNRHWGENTVPYLKVRGTGTLVMRNISARMAEKPGDYLWGKRAAFFMMPEIIRPYSVNFLTPVYADERSNLYFADLLGYFLIAASIAVTALSWKVKTIPARRIVINLSLLLMAVYSVHFLARFAPGVRATPFRSNEEKIARNMYDREMGELIKTAREKIPPHATVLLDSGESEYSKRIICFYLAPRLCAFARTPDSKPVYFTPCGYATVNPCSFELTSAPDAVMGYYPLAAPPSGFSKVAIINANVFIAVRP